jgi:hypothetical protein
MSETLVVAPASPGGWLAEHQRSLCDGASALSTFQGLISDEIVLPQSAATDPDPLRMVMAATGFVEALHNQAYFIPGEFASEALWSFYAHEYLAQAAVGGHAQYYTNRGADEAATRCASAGLRAMGAERHHQLFEMMMRLMQEPPKVAQKLARQMKYRDVVAAMRGLDVRLETLEANDSLTARHKAWLRGLRKTNVVTDEDLNRHLNRIAGSNRLYQQRRTEAERLRARRELQEPEFQAAKALCEMAGLRFHGLARGGFTPMRAVWPEGPNKVAYAFRVDTHRGPRAACFYEQGSLRKRRLAVLIERGEALPVGSLSMSKRDYAGIVPRVARAK